MWSSWPDVRLVISSSLTRRQQVYVNLLASAHTKSLYFRLPHNIFRQRSVLCFLRRSTQEACFSKVNTEVETNTTFKLFSGSHYFQMFITEWHHYNNVRHALWLLATSKSIWNTKESLQESPMEFLRASYTTNKAEWLIFKLQKATKSLQQNKHERNSWVCHVIVA